MNNMLTGLAQASNRAIAQQICKVVQAAHVRQPEIRGSVRIRGLVIEHDGFQVRLTPKAQVDCVLLRDLPGEAEGAGAGFIAHPLTTERADRFVIAVQRPSSRRSKRMGRRKRPISVLMVMSPKKMQ